jgi:hypothetical protein
MQGSIWILDSECKRQSQPCNRPGFEDRLLHKLGKTYVLLVVTKGESRRGAAAGDVRQKGRREGRTYKEAKNACGSLGFFLIATQGSFSGCASASGSRRIGGRFEGRRFKVALEGEQLRKALVMLWTRKEGACQAAQSRMRPITAGRSLAGNIAGIAGLSQIELYFQVAAIQRSDRHRKREAT